MNTAHHRSSLAVLLALAVMAPTGATRVCADANVIDQVLSWVGERPYSYDEYLAALTRFAASDRVDVVAIGRSAGGRTIPLVAVHAPHTVFGQTMRLFIVARQHGTECAGTEAIMAIMNHLVRSNAPSDLALLQRLTFVFVPVGNPDGAAGGTRGNANGVDLNRDWASRSQPETQAVDWALRVWQPHAFIDCHELPAESSRAAYQENFLETIAEDEGLRPEMTSLCSSISLTVRRYEVGYGSRLNVYYDDRSTDRGLAHRHVGLDYQVPSFLYESKTGAGRSLRERVRFHVVGLLVTANLLAQLAPVAPSAPQPAPPPIMIPRTLPPVQRAPSVPAQTVVRFASPSADRETFTASIPLKIEVKASPDFAFVSLHVDGVMRMLSDAVPYEHDLSIAPYDNGPHTLVCQAHDGSGRVLAEATRVVLVEKNVAAGR